jgi:tetratricopeptide (TPR) repeat protein
LFSEKLLHAKSIIEDEPDEALRICNDIMNDEFDSQNGQMALFMSGYIMMQAERYGLAYQIYQRCAQLRPDMPDIWSNMGMCLEDHDQEKAKSYFKRAYKLDKNNSRALANHGLICLKTAQPDKCIELSRKALAVDPNLRSAQHNIGLAKLMLRDWSGWVDYANTLGVQHREARDYGVPDWDGQPGTVLVYGEQGVGDEIMFASCLEDLMKTNKVILDCDKRLEGLFDRSFDCEVYGDRFKTESRAADQDFDYQCAIGQLPARYRLSDADYPRRTYLKVDPERSIQWRSLFDTFKGKKVGVAWRGGLKNTGEKKRSLEISDFEPIFNEEDTFISLEYKEVSRNDLDKYSLKAYPRATAGGGDIDDLAALIANLDYVVTCCTTVIYVAGALGIPCYVLVPSQPGYRYNLTGEFPWYESVKIIRQKAGERWRGVAARLRRNLEEEGVQKHDREQESA